MSGDRLTIFDTTLRDGEQAPGFSLRIDEKLKMARQLRTLGVDIIEAGFPIASDADAEAVRMVATHVQGPVVAALARCHPKDIEKAGWALAPAPRRRIHVFIATSDLHLERKLRITREECLRTAMAAVKLARQHTDDVQFSAEDATRTDPGFLWQVIEAVIQSGAKTMSAVHAGARQVECTINGIGERAGNASLEEIVMALRVRADRLPYETGVNSREIFASSQMLTALTGEGVQANKAIVGRNAFAHEAGIHQDGMLKDRRTYEIMRPEEVGVSATLVLGKHSGRHAVQKRCEQIGCSEMDRRTLDEVYRAVIEHADREKVVSDADLAAIVARVTGTAALSLQTDKDRPRAHAPAAADLQSTPAEVGYGHGV